MADSQRLFVAVTDKLLILDIDEALIFASEKQLSRESDLIVGNQFFVYKRPHLREFLEYCIENFEVAVWTAASNSYAAEIVEAIFPKGQTNLTFLWSRERCTMSLDVEIRENFLEKKMTKLRRRGYNLKKVIVVDDSSRAWRNSYGNLVRVKQYLGENEDDELKKLTQYLDVIKDADDIRKIEKRDWKNRL